MSDTSDDMEAGSALLDADSDVTDAEVLEFTLKLLKNIAREVSNDACEPIFWKSLNRQIKYIEMHLHENS